MRASKGWRDRAHCHAMSRGSRTSGQYECEAVANPNKDAQPSPNFGGSVVLTLTLMVTAQSAVYGHHRSACAKYIPIQPLLS